MNAVLAHAHEQYRTDLMSKAVVHADAIAGLLVAARLRPGPPGAVGGHEGVVGQEEAEEQGVRPRAQPGGGLRRRGDAGLPIDEFIAVAIAGIQQVAPEIGL